MGDCYGGGFPSGGAEVLGDWTKEQARRLSLIHGGVPRVSRGSCLRADQARQLPPGLCHPQTLSPCLGRHWGLKLRRKWEVT